MSVARIEPQFLAKGAGRGFNVLLIGGLLAPAAAFLPVIGPVWLALVAVAAFALAGSSTRDVTAPATHGALAALCSYLLMVPLVVIATRGLDVVQLVVTISTAVLVGAVAANRPHLYGASISSALSRIHDISGRRRAASSSPRSVRE